MECILFRVFGLVWNLRINEGEEMENLIDCVLHGHTEGQMYRDFTENDVKYYIKYINTKQVSLSDGAVELLKNYFVSTRRARGK